MSGTNVSREEIELLRASANSLIEDTAEPCWGLAQRLSQLAERLVIESGQAPAAFGNGVILSEGAAWLGGFMPECCPACGEWAGQHAAWCIHAHEGQAEQPELVASRERSPVDEIIDWEEQGKPDECPVHYSGCCPICHQEPVLYFAEDHSEYMVCAKHSLAWYVGKGNCSAWQYMTADQQAEHMALLVTCKVIDVPECTCSHSVEDEQAAADAYYEIEDQFTWLDLSGLPPVPPAGPPARKPTNWHFDAPDSGQVQGPEDYPF